MEQAHALVNVRDVNLLCQEYGNVYTLIEGETHRRKIKRARRRQGVLEVQTIARNIWMGPTIVIEWVNRRGDLVRYLEHDIR